jgi:DUF1680 family protein
MKLSVNGVEQTDAPVENGYILLDRVWMDGDKIDLSFELQVTAMRANPQVRADAGKIALVRGPLVYCLEEVDNGSNLGAMSIAAVQSFETEILPDMADLPVIRGKAFRLDETKWNEDMLKTAGFRKVDCFWRYLNFAGWIAIK